MTAPALLANKEAESRWFRHFPRLAGATVALLGLLIIASWHAHWQSVLQMLPNSAPMQYNSALCFVLTGTGLFLLTTARAKMASWLAGLVVLFTLVTLLEYLSERNFGLDLIFFQPYFEVDTVYSGRMSPLAAVCFILIGTGIILGNAKMRWPHRLTVAGILACMVGVIVLVALFGFAFGIEAAYGWGSYSRLAMNTAVVFLMLSGGLLAWTGQTARREFFSFLPWLPLTGAVTLMVMMAFVSTVNITELKRATFWRQQTMQAILNALSFEDNLIDLQRGTGGYVTRGDTNALAGYRSSAVLEARQFHQLVEQTGDNPAQQQHLKELAAAMADLFAYDDKVIALYQQRGANGVHAADVTGEKSRAIFDRAHDILKDFSQEEQRLLGLRDGLEQAHSRNAARLLVVGSVVAAVLLLLASYLTTREINQRRRVEVEHEKLIGELQRALVEIKTLWGLVPICAWCKNVRTDQGYWQSVEQYVRTRTDATFSHGMCPICAVKFRSDIHKQDV